VTSEPRPLVHDRERDEVIAVCCRAFWDDPLFDFLARGALLDEYELLPSVFRAAMRDFDTYTARCYVVDVEGKPRGLAAWLGPGSFPRSKVQQTRRDLRSIGLLARVYNRRAAIRLLREVDRRHPLEPHWYLGLLATDPTAQGCGYGTALIRPVLDHCDAQGIPAYTETQKHANVGWYARSGFEVIDELRLPGTPPIWRLWRDTTPYK
jgi:GNAT superfamily N-acetyltransferase